MSIEWGRQAQDALSSSTIKKVLSLHRTLSARGSYRGRRVEEEKLHDVEVLIDRFDVQLTATEFIAAIKIVFA